MPLYDYKCTNCIREDLDVVAKPDQYERVCGTCGGAMERQLPTPSIIPDIEPYLDEHMGHEPVYVKSRQHKKALLRERGLVMTG